MPTVPQLPMPRPAVGAGGDGTSLARRPTVPQGRSTATSRIPVRSMTSPPSRRARPAQSCPPPRTDSGRSWRRGRAPPPARPRVACRTRRSPGGGARRRSRRGSPSHRVRHPAAPRRIWSPAARPHSLSSLDPLKPASSHSFAPRPTTAEAAFRFAARVGWRRRLRRPCPALAAKSRPSGRRLTMATAKYSPVSFLRNCVSAVTNDSALDLKFSLVIRCCLSERDQE